jgi:hypothetical protein
MIAEASADPRVSAQVCETVGEFEQRTTAARAGGSIPDGGRAEKG